MEENVALDSTKQRKFVKSIKGIKKLIKKNDTENSEADSPKREKKRRKRPDRGLVYLSHIPHGFYEHEMNQYFKQFGMVTNVRVIRSKRTGNSKGCAFVEFREPAVAEIVAETMNNYLMGKRLIKAAIIPPEKQKPKAMRKHWSRFNNPGRTARLQMKKAYNENKDEAGDLKRARKILSNIKTTVKKLSESGINYDFFTPVDVPEALQETLKEEKEVSNEVKENIKQEKKSKKGKNEQTLDVKDTKETTKKNKLVKLESQVIKQDKNKAVKADVKQESAVKIKENKLNISKKDIKNKKIIEIQEPVANKKEQTKKQQKLKDAGVNPPENFVSIQQEAQDSDSSVEFDSDEYEKMLADSDDESDINEGDDSDDAGSDEDDESDDEEEEIIPPPKKSKAKPPPAVVAVPPKQGKKQKGNVVVVPEQNKRKTPQKAPVASKKPKFEKQTQKPMKKQFKKKK